MRLIEGNPPLTAIRIPDGQRRNESPGRKGKRIISILENASMDRLPALNLLERSVLSTLSATSTVHPGRKVIRMAIAGISNSIKYTEHTDLTLAEAREAHQHMAQIIKNVT